MEVWDTIGLEEESGSVTAPSPAPAVVAAPSALPSVAPASPPSVGGGKGKEETHRTSSKKKRKMSSKSRSSNSLNKSGLSNSQKEEKKAVPPEIDNEEKEVDIVKRSPSGLALAKNILKRSATATPKKDSPSHPTAPQATPDRRFTLQSPFKKKDSGMHREKEKEKEERGDGLPHAPAAPPKGKEATGPAHAPPTQGEAPGEALNPMDTRDNQERLYKCVRNGAYDTLEVLLRKGVNPNYLDEEGGTPLILAVKKRSLGLLSLLLSSPKIDVNLVVPSSALLEAAKLEHRNEIEKQENLVINKLLIQAKGADVNIRDGAGTTPLLYATLLNNMGLAKMLVDYGADVNLSNAVGFTPLHNASANNNLDMILFLLDNGATPIKNMDGCYPQDLTPIGSLKSILEGKVDSYYHPLEITFIDIIYGKLGFTICPGRCDKPYRRSLVDDMKVLKSVGCEALVSLVTETELSDMMVPQLIEEVKKEGMTSIFCPIKNRWIPPLVKFSGLIFDIVKLLDKGKTVIVHCDSGKGRTGLVVGGVLLAMGFALERATQILKTKSEEMLRNPAHLLFLTAFDYKLKDLSDELKNTLMAIYEQNELEDAKASLAKIEYEVSEEVSSLTDTDLTFQDEDSKISFIGEIVHGWQNKHVRVLISHNSLQFLDPKTGSILESWHLKHLKAWGARPSAIVLDFGSEADEMIVIKTNSAERIDTLLKKMLNKIM